MGDISLYSKRCWFNETFNPATIVMRDGIICDILSYKTNDALDVGDSVIMPGVIDTHVHVNEPGRTDWEGFQTATAAAAKGGITTIIDMPLNARPVTTTLSAFKEKIASTKDKLSVNCGFYGGLVPANAMDLEALLENGVFGIKCFLTHSGIDEFPNVAEQDLNIAMPVLSKHGSKLLVHCELMHENSHENAGEGGSYESYVKSRPDDSETRAVKLMIDMCRKHACAVHIVHVSSSESLTLIKRAKEEGLPVSAETCTHYIYFNAEDIPDNMPVFKCAPPIRGRKNNAELRQALNAGILDFLTSDHSPAPPEIKQIETGDIRAAWGGIAGLQFLLSGGWTACRGEISLETFIPLLTSKPAAFLGLANKKGKLQTGFDADLTIWNPEASYKVLADEIEHKHKISPYIGENLFGLVEHTYVNGKLVYDRANNNVSAKAGKIMLTPTNKRNSYGEQYN